MGQRLKEVQVRHGVARSASLGAERTHPLRGARNRAAQTPPHNQQSDQRDDHHLHQHAQKSIAPHQPRLRPDVTGILYDCQAADDMVLLVQRHHVNMEGGIGGAGEFSFSLVCQQLRPPPLRAEF